MSGQDIVNCAKKYLGVPYVFGGTTPRGFDCSGFVKYVYAEFGHVLSRTTAEQINNGRAVSRNELQPGDLVFPNPGHVTIYIGDNHVIHAPKPGQVVKIEKLWAFWKARRIVWSPPPPPPPPPPPHRDEWLKGPLKLPPGPFPIKTILHPTGNNFDFLMGDYNHDGYLDLYCIKKRNTGSKSVEVHILSGKSNFKKWLLQTKTPHPEVDDNTTFLLGDYNLTGTLDLYCIQKRGHPCGKIYLNILKGSSRFTEWMMNVAICVDAVGDNVDLDIGDFVGDGMPDLYCITKYKEGWTKAGVLIIKARNNYQSLLMDTGSKLNASRGDSFFGITNYVGHGKKDLYVINRNPNSIGFSVVDGTCEKLFQTSLMDTGFSFSADHNCSFIVYWQKIFVIKKNGANCTEVHLL